MQAEGFVDDSFEVGECLDLLPCRCELVFGAEGVVELFLEGALGEGVGGQVVCDSAGRAADDYQYVKREEKRWTYLEVVSEPAMS